MTAPTPDLAADIERVLRAAPHMPLSFEERDCFMRILAASRRTAEAEEERHYVLRDWNALVKAIGSPTHGAAIGFGSSLKAEVESLRSRLAQAQNTLATEEAERIRCRDGWAAAERDWYAAKERAEAAERQLAGLLRERDALAQIDPERDLAVELERVQRQLAEARAARDGMLREVIRCLDWWRASGMKPAWTPPYPPGACTSLIRAAGMTEAEARAALGEEGSRG